MIAANWPSTNYEIRTLLQKPDEFYKLNMMIIENAGVVTLSGLTQK
jgi:hypothetical protein